MKYILIIPIITTVILTVVIGCSPVTLVSLYVQPQISTQSPLNAISATWLFAFTTLFAIWQISKAIANYKKNN